MHMRSVLISAVLAGCMTTPVRAAATVDESNPVIVVLGTGTASHPADFTVISMSVEGEGADNVAALKQLASAREKVEQGLRGLGGAKSMMISTGTLSIHEARSPKCEPDGYRAQYILSQGDCQILGAVATLALKIKVAPAPLAGSAASLAAQLGASDITIDDSDVFDAAALQTEAGAIALAHAKSQAGRIAEAMGVRLGPIIRVDDNNGRRGVDAQIEEFVVTGSRIPSSRPVVEISLAPAPITRDASYTVTYGIIR